MEKYILELKNEKLKAYDRIALFILLINLLLFIITALSASEKIMLWTATGALIMIGSLLAFYFFLKRSGKVDPLHYLVPGFFIASLEWFILKQPLIAVPVLVLGILYLLSRRKLKIGFQTDQISISSFPEKTISWSEMNNVILKDGLLTLDFRNNKVIQAEIINHNGEINEPEFNDFCRAQLRK